MAALYRQQMSGRELELIARQWEELCTAMSDSDFTAAVEKHKQRNDFFPKPANVLKIHDELLQAYQPTNAPALPEASCRSDFDRWGSLVSARVCLKASKALEFKTLAEAYFAAEPGMSRHRESLARKILGDEFPEFDDFMTGNLPPARGWTRNSRRIQKCA